MKVLIIEDEIALAESIGSYLSENYVCEFAYSFSQAIEKIENHNYDCVLLDLMLPGGNGLDILRELKTERKREGVIIISAKGSLEDKVNGLQIGADDYLAKPFHLPELAARIHSVVRRKYFGDTNTIASNEINIDLLSQVVSVKNQPISLTRREYDLLLYFISNKNKVISKAAIAEHISGDIADMFDSHEFIYAHIKNLKKKLSDAGAENYLKTLYGRGYKWEA